MTSPTPEGIHDESAPVSSGALVPLTHETRPALPEPSDLARILKDQIEEAVAASRKARGLVLEQEDTFPLVRDLRETQSRLGEYASAFKRSADHIQPIIEEELIEAVGEKDGIPTSGMRVPAAGGDITVNRDMDNVYSYDMPQVISAVTALIVGEWEDRAIREPDTSPIPGEAPEEFAIAVALRVLDLFGAKLPGVTKIKAVATDLSRAGQDRIAAAVRGAITKTEVYKGITITQKPAA